MACVGGCINGPAAIEAVMKAKQQMAKENAVLKDKTISSTLEIYDFKDIDMHR